MSSDDEQLNGNNVPQTYLTFEDLQSEEQRAYLTDFCYFVVGSYDKWKNIIDQYYEYFIFIYKSKLK